jgi:hypothetical protein
VHNSTQDYVLGYSQPDLSKLAFWSAIDRGLEGKIWVGVVLVVLTLSIHLHWSSAVVSHSSQNTA